MMLLSLSWCVLCFEGNPLVVVAKAIYVREFPKRNKRLNLHTLSTWESPNKGKFGSGMITSFGGLTLQSK